MISQNDKDKFIEELKEIPIVSIVCKRTGIGKSTFYRWMHEDMDFNEKVYKALEVGRENITDIAEGQLIGAMRKGEKWAIQCVLENNSRRYYKPKRVQDTLEAPYLGITEISMIRGKTPDTKTDNKNE